MRCTVLGLGKLVHTFEDIFRGSVSSPLFFDKVNQVEAKLYSLGPDCLVAQAMGYYRMGLLLARHIGLINASARSGRIKVLNDKIFRHLLVSLTGLPQAIEERNREKIIKGLLRFYKCLFGLYEMREYLLEQSSYYGNFIKALETLDVLMRGENV